MNRTEEKILNGIFRNNKKVNDAVYYKVAELNWLIKNDLREGNQWEDGNGGLKSCGCKENGEEHYSCQLGVLIDEIEGPLSYLNGKGLIEYAREQNSFHISITASGADVARKLQKRTGRIDLWYQENKDGVIWLLITIITSVVVTVITALTIEHLK